jgi:SWIM zinc finger
MPSAVRRNAGRSEVLLGTSGGVTEVGPELHPYFFQGFLAEPGPAAAGMLACAAVARARYYTPASVIAAIVADPVVTSNGDRLRFESFSGCCGVHARLDLLPDALAGQPVRSGSTNVDFSEGMRAALGGAAVAGPLLLSVGADEVAVATLDASVTERKVTLPERWLKGFGEVQALARDMRLVAELAGAEVQRFIQVIPRSARRPLWAVPAGRGLALAASPQPGAACLAGPHRLAELGPLLRFARGLRVYGPPVGARSLPVPSAWELDLGRARFTLTLSPETYRGFSGEGALLGLLADTDAVADADLVSVLLAWDPRIDAGRLSAEAGLRSGRVAAALGCLAAAGRVGYDLAEEAFFHRELPFGAALETMHPRLAGGRELISAGSVILAADGAGAVVRSGGGEHRVTFTRPRDTCTCPWWGKYRGTRGPCRHVLAARMAAGQANARPRSTAAGSAGEVPGRAAALP